MIQHGLFGRKENWKTIGKELNHITNRTVYNIDGRNHGESPHTDEMTFALMAKDIKQFCEQNNHEKISFLGKFAFKILAGILIILLICNISNVVIYLSI